MKSTIFKNRMRTLVLILIAFWGLTACSKNSSGTVTVVKPRHHHTHYQHYAHKKKWHIGRIRLRFEKQGVKKVKMKS
jgi:hypothetical protein